MSLIYKILGAQAWAAAKAAGVFEGAPVDQADGFIHFSTAAQVRESAAKHRRGRTDLRLLFVPATELGPRLKWEAARGGQLFPHLYGTLPVTVVTRAVDLPLGPDGAHIFPELEA